jgi:type I restriction-modification system DNA methylase subunit
MIKEQERAELHRAIWQIANDLRGSVDGWDFKQYVLGMLFYRFISENLTIYINADERRSGNKDFDYANLTDKKAEFGRADTVREKGFYILPSELFVNVRAKARNDANLNETPAAVFRNIESSAKGSDSEDDLTIYNLCRINMFLHNINYNHFDIAHGDTLTDPKHWDDEPFDAIVSNPPYSTKWEGKDNSLLINDPRFSPAGVLAPKSKADLAFTMHMLSWLSTIGTAAIVEFPGVLYRSGAEQKIRKYLVDNNYIDTVIQLPPDLFFGTTIATCIIVLKKSKKDNKTLFIDASAEFVRGGNKNKLSDENRARILKAFTARKDGDHFARLVDNKIIEENDYNIAVSTYVAQKDTREVIDITKLNAEIADIVARQNELRTAIDKIVADIEGSRQ